MDTISFIQNKSPFMLTCNYSEGFNIALWDRYA